MYIYISIRSLQNAYVCTHFIIEYMYVFIYYGWPCEYIFGPSVQIGIE